MAFGYGRNQGNYFISILTEAVILHSVNWLYHFYRTVRTSSQQ